MISKTADEDDRKKKIVGIERVKDLTFFVMDLI